MADNVAFTPGTGATGATDDIGGIHYPRVKATWGPDGTANDVDAPVAKRFPVVGTKVIAFKSIVLTADTSILANGDIIADTQQLDAAFRVADGTGRIRSIVVFDPDDNTPFSFYIGLHRTSTSLGSENSGISITDANAIAGLLYMVPFTAGDCVDLINGRMYQRENLDIPIVAVSGTDDLYVSMVNIVGTPTFAGGAVTVLLGIEHD